jgi:hypothetical protein
VALTRWLASVLWLRLWLLPALWVGVSVVGVATFVTTIFRGCLVARDAVVKVRRVRRMRLVGSFGLPLWEAVALMTGYRLTGVQCHFCAVRVRASDFGACALVVEYRGRPRWAVYAACGGCADRLQAACACPWDDCQLLTEPPCAGDGCGDGGGGGGA